MSWAAAIGAGGAIIGGYLSKEGAKEQAKSGQLDPRLQSMLYGENGSQGLFGKLQGQIDTPQSPAMQAYTGAAGDYLTKYAGSDMGAMRDTAMRTMNGGAPTMRASGVAPPAWLQGTMVNAPSQNGINLTPTFNNLLSGGNNTALKDSLKFGTDLTGAQFQKNQTDVTNNLMRNVMPSIRSNSVLAGQYGGSRQGIAEGNALSDYTNQLTNANTQIGLANSANTTGQLANSYEQGQNRALAAAQGLSAQQYATSFKNNDTQNAAEFGNVATHNSINENYANREQAAGLANLQSQLTSNGQALNGAGFLGNLLGSNANATNAGDNYGLDRLLKVTGAMTPLMGIAKTNPIYTNVPGQTAGGAMAGMGFAQGLFGGGGGGGSNPGTFFDMFGKNSSFSGGGYI